ncbi:hypothetical protein [Dickeya dianthicola]|uniref:hypothetical protein n=1 Tax=Dickeya dianthicola TaxID=204039 RepID=UPI003017B9FA
MEQIPPRLSICYFQAISARCGSEGHYADGPEKTRVMGVGTAMAQQRREKAVQNTGKKNPAIKAGKKTGMVSMARKTGYFSTHYSRHYSHYSEKHALLGATIDKYYH